MNRSAALLGLLGLCLLAGAADLNQAEEKARLLASKQLLNKFVVESMDVVIKYSVFNVGNAAANNVQLKDTSFGPDFNVVAGQTEVSLGRIPPQGNVSHTVVVRPLKSGYYNFTAAEVSYTSGEDAEVS